MNAVDLLVSQHRTIESMMKEFMDAKSPQTRKALFRKVGDHLTTHIASEEEIFYPAVRAKRTEDILLESLEEHLSLKRILADLLTMDETASTYETKFHVLQEQAEHHHKEEEENLFPKVKALLDESVLDKLGNEMAALQERLQKEGKPRDAVTEQTAEAAPLRG